MISVLPPLTPPLSKTKPASPSRSPRLMKSPSSQRLDLPAPAEVVQPRVGRSAVGRFVTSWLAKSAVLLGLAVASSALAQSPQTFTTSGNWTVPSGVTSVTVQAWGAGGNGGSSNNGSTSVRGGGGGGAYASSVISVNPGDIHPIQVGAAGGFSGFGQVSGGNYAVRAEGGATATSSTGGVGGSAGSGSTPGTTGTIGTTRFAGGAGRSVASGAIGGGGGSSAGTALIGVTASGQTGATAPPGGGNGGSGGASNTAGSAGAVFGGGGGGAGTHTGGGAKAGGAGGAGRVVLTYTGPGANGIVNVVTKDTATGDIYVGGAFTSIVGTAANRIAKYNGSAWVALGSGLGAGSEAVTSIVVVSSTEVYAAGNFTGRVSKWNGSTWTAMTTTAPSVAALAFSGGTLYAGSANGTVAKWTGSAWSNLGTGATGEVKAMAVIMATNSSTPAT